MNAIVLTVIFFVINAGVGYLPVLGNPVYFSADKPRADSLSLASANSRPPFKKDIASLGPQITAQAALVVDKDSGAVLLDYNSETQLPLASITKLMTALLVLEAEPDLKQKLLMIEADQREGADRFIKPGEDATLESYLKASLLGSANNATIALSRSTGLTNQEFVDEMNAMARELGMTSTVFTDPSGLDPNNKSTARDIAVFLFAAQKNQIIRSITSKFRDYIAVYPSGIRREIITTNQLIGSMIDVSLGKTGYLEESLYNLVTVVKLKNSHEIFVVTLGSASSQDRFADNKVLAVWVESTYKWQ